MRQVLVARGVGVLAGIWLIAAPAVIGYSGAAANNDRIVGPIAAALAFVAAWPIAAALRWPTVPCGLWLIVSAIVIGSAEPLATVSTIAAGLVITAAGFVGSDERHRFDGGWRTVRPRAWQE